MIDVKTELLDIAYSLAVRRISERVHQAAKEQAREIRTPHPEHISVRAQPSSGLLALAEGLDLLFNEVAELRQELSEMREIVVELQSELGNLDAGEEIEPEPKPESRPSKKQP